MPGSQEGSQESEDIMNSTMVQLEFFKTQRERLFAKLNAIYDFSKKVAPGSVNNFLARCTDLARIRDKFDITQENITRLNLTIEDTSKRLDLDQVQTSFDDIYYSVKSVELNLNVRLGRVASSPPPAPIQPPQCDFRMPALEIPTFSGDLSKFQNFFSLFNSLVHTANYAPTIKLSYLRRYLEGSPLALIEDLDLVDENYNVAYALIKDRYADPRGLAACYVNKMLDFQPLSSSSLTDLQSFLDVFNANAKALDKLELADAGDFIKFQIALRALPPHMRTLFERSLPSRDEIPSFTSLVDFVQSQCKIEELSRKSMPLASKPNQSGKNGNGKGGGQNTNKTQNRSPRNPQSLLVTPNKGPAVTPAPPMPSPQLVSNSSAPLTQVTSSDKQTFVHICPFCQSPSHKPYQCDYYRSLTLAEKKERVNTLKRCGRCLGHHKITSCKSKFNCWTCGSPDHHTSLHESENSSKATSSQSSSLQEPSPPASGSSKVSGSVPSSQTLLTGALVAPPPRTTLLGTAQGLIRNKWGKLEPMRMVIDSGSQICLISSGLTKRLGLPLSKKCTEISGALNQTLGSSEGVISCAITPRDTQFPVLVTEAVVVNKVCLDLPCVPLSLEIYNRFKHLKLADNSFHQRGPIDFLLGASLFSKILGGSCDVIPGEPSALNTVFGYVIIGDVSQILPPPAPALSLFMCDVNLDRTLQNFWRIEEVANPPHNDPDHEAVEQHFITTHTRKADGSFVVRLPFKTPVENIRFHDIQEIARRRWYNLEARLRKNEGLRKAYHAFMEEYLALGHMRPATHPGAYYIPHFGIVRDSPTSPLRVVFDASCKDSSGASLNDHLHTGPPLQNDICQVITLFRLHPIAVSSDIRMMYRKIWCSDEDTKFQHIFWRPNEDEPLVPYELLTVTYGTSAAPYLAIRCLIQNSLDYGSEFPRAAAIIRESCYIDDIVYSVSTVEEALALKHELSELLSRGCFELRKWASNSEAVLADIPTEHRLPSLSLQSTEPSSLHILGVKWEPTADIFTYDVKPLPDCRTKRQVSSYIASIFDPLGWVAPALFTAKLFLREIWERSTHWDDPLPEDIRSRWAEFSLQLSELSQIEFPRLLLPAAPAKIQLIGFCDASALGYAACIYLRTISETGDISVRLIKSKSRVAPLKVLTIPRLELLGALQLAKLLESVSFLFSNLVIGDTILLTDSSVVLGWLHTAPHRLQTFVANRVVNILELTTTSQWHHIRTAQNIADDVSRGLYPTELVNHPSWWAGPSFLYESIDKWPIDQLSPASDLPEIKKVKQILVATRQSSKPKDPPLIVSMIENSSRLSRLKRVLAWMLRFIHNCRQHGQDARKTRIRGPLQPEELDNSMLVCVKATQRQHFSNELKKVQKGTKLNARISRLTPFLHHGILRVGGRLSHSLLPYEAKHPILLPKDAHLSKLICDSFHKELMHAGPQACQAAIVQEYWILSLRSILRKRIFTCNSCYRQKISQQHPVMADLPASRITPCRPFDRASVDFAGPIFIKDGARRNSPRKKAYICIFVCHVTKAVHMELVGSLATECYVAALTRFISRRGLCREIHCDNGTNFVGASNENQALLEFLTASHEPVTDYLSERKIQYHFNTPEAPWTGGLHEAAVKSAKRHLYSLSDRLLTYEEMATVLTRIEAILNSRPLTPIGDSPDSVYLSPGHFLVGGPLLQPLEYDLTNEPQSHLTRWQHTQQAAQLFWKRWSANYLHTLMERQKWTTPRTPLQVGDVVIMLRNNSGPMDWPLGRILELHSGSDGIARTALVKTTSGVFKRPVAKLAPLPPQE